MLWKGEFCPGIDSKSDPPAVEGVSNVLGGLVADDREAAEFDDGSIRLKGGLEGVGFVSTARSESDGLDPDRLRNSVGCCASRLAAPFT